MESNHYCADCDTHFRLPPEEHARIEHDDGLFRGVVDGDYRDYFRATRPRRYV